MLIVGPITAMFASEFDVFFVLDLPSQVLLREDVVVLGTEIGQGFDFLEPDLMTMFVPVRSFQAVYQQIQEKPAETGCGMTTVRSQVE